MSIETQAPPAGFASMREYHLRVLESLGIDTANLAGKVDDHVAAIHDFYIAQARRSLEAQRFHPAKPRLTVVRSEETT